MKSLEGHFLIASPELRDPNFAKSVVLLIKHSDEGAFGLILNRPTGTKVKDVWSKVSEGPCEIEDVLHLGGPVQGPLMAIHRDEQVSGLEILPGVLFSTEASDLEKLFAQSEHPVRFFVGYAGWGAGQLESELEENSWLTSPADSDQIFAHREELWERIRRQLSGESILNALGIKRRDVEPGLN